jgi:hypothetical protein
MDEELAKLSGRVALVLGPEKTCEGKVKHRTYTHAAQAVKEIRERGGQEKNAYPCPWCYHWHIGRKMTREELQAHANSR